MEVPVALVIYRRARLVRRLLRILREVRPTELYVIADGPRSESELKDTIATRRVLEQVDWPCEVRTTYSTANLGVNRRIPSGLDWVFTQTDRAIILEEDCHPHPSFFRYCEDLLDRFEHDPNVLTISGYNREAVDLDYPYSYRFTRTMWVWGWATWRDRYQSIDFSMAYWRRFKQSKRFESYFSAVSADPAEAWREEAWRTRLDMAAEQNAWDFALSGWSLHRNLRHVVPTRSLVRNVGWGDDATHTVDRTKALSVAAEEVAFPLAHPPDDWPVDLE